MPGTGAAGVLGSPIRDFFVGRLALPTVDVPIGELLGGDVATTGDSTAVSQRRVKGFALELPIHGGTGDVDPYAVGQRMRRQLRSILQNHDYRNGGLFCRFYFDPERDGWMVIATAQLLDADGGPTLANYTLQIDSAFRVGGIPTHREGFRVTLTDRRLSTSALDTLGQLINTSTWFASQSGLSLIAAPTNAYDLAVLESPPTRIQRLGSDGYCPICVGRSDGDVVSWERVEGAFNRGDVVVYDRRGNVGPFGGANYDLTYVVSQNLVANPGLEYDAIGATPGFWTGSISGTGTLSTFQAQLGWSLSSGATASARATVTGLTSGSYGQFATPIPPAAGSIPVTALSAYSFGAVVNVLSRTSTTATLNAFWFTAGGAFISQVASSAVSALGVSQLSILNATAPATAAFAQILVTFNSSAPGGAMDAYLDAFQAVPGATLPSYWDGDSPGYVWSGTPGGSISQQLLDPQTSYGWEEVYGADYPWLAAGDDAPVVQNSFCRVRYDTSNVAGFRIDVWGGTTWVEQGKVWFNRRDSSAGGGGTTNVSVLVESALVEYSPEKAVVVVVMRSATDALSRERIYITLQRGWTAPRFEVYAASGTDGTVSAVGAAINYTELDVDTNDSAVCVDSGPTGVDVATAGSGSALFSGAALGASTFTGENWISLLRQGRAYSVAMAAVQATAGKWQQSDTNAYGASRNTIQFFINSTGYISAQLGFYAQGTDQVMEAESITLAAGTTSVADAAASNGNAAQAARSADAIHVSRATWMTAAQGKYRIFVRLRPLATSTDTIDVYAKTTATTGATKTATGASYVWVDLGDIVADGSTLEIHAWNLTAARTFNVDRIEAVKVEDRTRALALYDGARDLGSSALYDVRPQLRRLWRQ